MARGERRRLQDILERARADFDDMNSVAFIGARHSGKTVHYALLKDAATRHLARRTRGRYGGIATAGGGRIDKIVGALYGGNFPQKTAQGEAIPLAVEIAATKNGSNVTLIFNDMAGEEYDELLTSEMPVEQRIQGMLDTPGIDGKPYGLMTHLIFARMYVVVIDCSAIETWGSSQAYVKDAIQSMYEIKKYTRDLYNNKMVEDIIIVFSKCDTLSGDKSVDELANELPEVGGIIKRCVVGDVTCFKSRLESIEMDEEEIREARAGRLDESLAEAKKKVAACQSTLDRATSRLEAEKSALNAATPDFDAAKASGDPEASRSCQAAHDKARRRYEEADRERSSLMDSLSSARAEVEEISSKDPADGDYDVGRYRPARPLSYNTDEYLDMITWMIKRANRAMGR